MVLNSDKHFVNSIPDITNFLFENFEILEHRSEK